MNSARWTAFIKNLSLTFALSLTISLPATSQGRPAAFTFVWESGEHSMDASFEDFVWQWDGKVLSYMESASGRQSGMQASGSKRAFPVKVALNRDKRKKLAALLQDIEKAESLSLLPQGFQGNFESYTLSFGSGGKELSFEVASNRLDHSTGELLDDSSGDVRFGPASLLLDRLHELRDFLLKPVSR